jgi:glucuronate isomerase
MSNLHRRLLDKIMTIRAVDVHSHVPAGAPFAETLRDLLGYHYYTELAHSAGMEKAVVADGRSDEEMIAGLVAALGPLDNTAQYGWMIELARELFGFQHDRLTSENWPELADAVRDHAARPDRAREVLDASNLDATFLTNEFDEDLGGIDTRMFVPSLRADTLVFKLAEPGVAARLEKVTGQAPSSAGGMRRALGVLVEKFKAAGARSAAISLPPFCAAPAVHDRAWEVVLADAAAGESLEPAEQFVLSAGTLHALAAACDDAALPMQVMYGAVRDAYPHGVYQGTDLPLSGDSITGLLPLFNAFPRVTFCLSVLNQSQMHELNSIGWIVQNVVLSGHWWYANVPAYIAPDLAARLQSVPKTKLIGYYSDMYKLEFGLPKFNMYRRTLARVLADDFVALGLGTEEDAVQIAHLLLNENPRRIFGL